MRETCDAHGLIPGMHCDGGEAARAFAAQGFKLITVGVDSSLLKSTIARELAAAQRPSTSRAPPSRHSEPVATWDDVRRIALALPETSERQSHGHPAWRVKDKLFVWDRPLRKSDLAGARRGRADGTDPRRPRRASGRQGGAARRQPRRVLHHAAFRRLPRRAGALDRISLEELNEVIVEAWLVRAPQRLAEQYIEANVRSGD